MDYSKIASVIDLPIAPVGMYVIDKSEFVPPTKTAWLAALIDKIVSLKPSILRGEYTR